jgi:hypothetical protein
MRGVAASLLALGEREMRAVGSILPCLFLLFSTLKGHERELFAGQLVIA